MNWTWLSQLQFYFQLTQLNLIDHNLIDHSFFEISAYESKAIRYWYKQSNQYNVGKAMTSNTSKSLNILKTIKEFQWTLRMRACNIRSTWIKFADLVKTHILKVVAYGLTRNVQHHTWLCIVYFPNNTKYGKCIVV